MTLVRYNPNRNLFNSRSSVDHLFNDFFGLNKGIWPENSMDVVPAVNLEETENAYKISVELPGMTKEDIQISLENKIVTISGEKKAVEEQKDKNFHRVERSYGKFQREFKLTSTLDRDKILAEYTNGVLDVTVPKAEEAKPKQIEIKVK